MKIARMAFLAASVLALKSPAAASEAIELSKKYIGSALHIGYMDHFHHEEKGREIHFAFSGVAFSRQVQMDPFFTFENDLKEAGLSFPIKVNQRIYILPAMFRNFDADKFGLAINATVLLR